MKQLKNILLITILMLVAQTELLFAQKPSFFGTWRLKEKTLVNGKNFDNALAPFVTYSSVGDSIRVKKAGDPANVHIIFQTTDRVYLPGKKQVSVNDAQVTVQRYLNWLDVNKSWELVSAGSMPGKPEEPDYAFRDVWSYDATSNLLNVEMTFKSTTEPANFCTFKAVYERVKF